MDEPTGYCPTCHKEQILLDGEPVVMPMPEGGVEVLKGICAVCGGPLYETPRPKSV